MNILDKTKELIEESEEMIALIGDEPTFAIGLACVKLDVERAKKAVADEDAMALLEAITKLEGFLESC